jgi:hypothetical protein
MLTVNETMLPVQHGFQFEKVDNFNNRGPRKVTSETLKALKNCEVKYPGIAQALLEIFHPGPMNPADELWWTEGKQGGVDSQSESAKALFSGPRFAVVR